MKIITITIIINPSMERNENETEEIDSNGNEYISPFICNREEKRKELKKYEIHY